jgi:hypothetical protein
MQESKKNGNGGPTRENKQTARGTTTRTRNKEETEEDNEKKGNVTRKAK